MENAAIHDLAERYLSGQLDATEREGVDTLLETDKAFGTEFANYLIVKQKIKERMEAERKGALMAKLKILGEKSSPDKGIVRRRLILPWLAAAAAVFLLAFMAYWLWPRPSTADRYAEARQEVYQKRIYQQTTRADENRFAELFKNKDFPAALAEVQTQFDQASDTKKWKWQERQGFCYWQLGEWESALTVFQDLAESPRLLPEKNPALWYQALTYWEIGNKARSEALLREIAGMDGYEYQGAARELLAGR